KELLDLLVKGSSSTSAFLKITHVRRPNCHGGSALPIRIRAKAPLRLSFAGGGTDVAPFPEREGGCVLSATISRYSWGTLMPREDGQIHLESADLGALFYFDTRSNLVYDGKMDLAKAAIRTLSGQDSSGFDLFLKTDAPPGSGLGSSSSLMVNMIG